MDDNSTPPLNERQKEVRRLAAMAIEDCAAEVKMVALKLNIGVGELKEAIRAVRSATKADKKRQEQARANAVRNDHTRFKHGSAVEIPVKPNPIFKKNSGGSSSTRGSFGFSMACIGR
jgi:hypothetical protein